jgi:hypothetical protein
VSLVGEPAAVAEAEVRGLACDLIIWQVC